MSYDVAIIGCGRVGLPLALAFADRGLRVIGVDNDAQRLATLRDGRMPFAEPGADELLARLHGDERLQWSSHVADAAEAESIVITLGTPSFSHIEIDLRDIRSVLDDLLPLLRDGQQLVLRSTIAPGHDRLRRRLPRAAARPRRGPRRVRLARPRAHRREPLLRGDRDAAVHRRRRRRALGRGRRAPVRDARRAGRARPRRSTPSSRRSGPTSCATRCSRSRTA